LRPDYRNSGGVHHFVKVKVSGDSYDLRVVTDRGELRDAEADVMGGLVFADRNCSTIGLDTGSPDLRTGVRCSVSLTNPYLEVLTGEAAWNLGPGGSSVEPPRIPFQISPGETHHLSFTLKLLQAAVPNQSLPRLEFTVVAGKRHHRFYREVLFLPKVLTRYRPVPPVLDGRLEDWGGVPPHRLGNGVNHDAEVRAVHDEKTLYLAVAVPATKAAVSDESAVRDDLQIGIAGRLSDTDFGADLIRLGFTCTGQAVEARDRTPGRRAEATVPAVKGACRKAGDRTNFEIGVPSRLLKSLKTGEKSRLVLNLAFPVPDEEPDAQEPADPALNSVSYQVRYGGDPLVPVHYVELILEPKR